MSGPAHRSVSNIRPSAGGVHSPIAGGTPGSPHTPVRAISSNYASPSTLRAEEDLLVIEFGSRYLRAGFAGDTLPKAVIGFGLEQQKRAGDYREWQIGYDAEWRSRERGSDWGEGRELWKMDLRDLDLGLVGDKIDRALREAFTKYLLVDSRPRKVALVLPSALPLPLLSTILDTLFNNFLSPTISLMSAPALTTVGAGLRAALVVDVGWAETVVTGIYEYREVLTRRTIRAGKMLGQEMLKVLAMAMRSRTMGEGGQSKEANVKDHREAVSFEECEGVVNRMGWCMPFNSKFPSTSARNQDERRKSIEASMQALGLSNGDAVSIPLSSTNPPVTLSLPFTSLARPCENAFFADGIDPVLLDDEEIPLHLLVYQTLLHLPLDVRSICMSRIIFTGGGSNLPGLKNRVIDEVSRIIEEREWDLVQGVAVDELRRNENLRTNFGKQTNVGLTDIIVGETQGNSSRNAAMKNQEPDPIVDKIRRDANRKTRPSAHGTLRVVDSLGPWTGASLLSQLKISSVSVVDREQWIQHGAAGASKLGDIAPTTQRQSMGAAGLRTGAGDRLSWTLGSWG